MITGIPGTDGNKGLSGEDCGYCFPGCTIIIYLYYILYIFLILLIWLRVWIIQIDKLNT